MCVCLAISSLFSYLVAGQAIDVPEFVISMVDPAVMRLEGWIFLLDQLPSLEPGASRGAGDGLAISIQRACRVCWAWKVLPLVHLSSRCGERFQPVT